MKLTSKSKDKPSLLESKSFFVSLSEEPLLQILLLEAVPLPLQLHLLCSDCPKTKSKSKNKNKKKEREELESAIRN